jgi:hypothetical protein
MIDFSRPSTDNIELILLFCTGLFSVNYLVRNISFKRPVNGEIHIKKNPTFT